MRKWNAILSMGILVLFLIHGIAGGLQAAGLLPGGNPVMKVMAWIMFGLIALHTVIGVKLTADTLHACRISGASYYKENRLFWLRRVSGLAIMAFIATHLLIFTGTEDDGIVRLHLFGGMQLATQILLVASIAVHVLCNIRPLMIALGVRGGKELFLDVLVVLSGILLFTGIAFVIYYIRWNVI